MKNLAITFSIIVLLVVLVYTSYALLLITVFTLVYLVVSSTSKVKNLLKEANEQSKAPL